MMSATPGARVIRAPGVCRYSDGDRLPDGDSVADRFQAF